MDRLLLKRPFKLLSICLILKWSCYCCCRYPSVLCLISHAFFVQHEFVFFLVFWSTSLRHSLGPFHCRWGLDREAPPSSARCNHSGGQESEQAWEGERNSWPLLRGCGRLVHLRRNFPRPFIFFLTFSSAAGSGGGGVLRVRGAGDGLPRPAPPPTASRGQEVEEI